MRTLTIELLDFAHLDGVERYLRIVGRLKEAGFEFEPVYDLFPAALDLAKPYSVTGNGSLATFTQSSASNAAATISPSGK